MWGGGGGKWNHGVRLRSMGDSSNSPMLNSKANERESNPEPTQSAEQLLEYEAEKEGYWTGNRFMKLVENPENIVHF